jgi:murein DD-endopeptidase MepM/ murein hydrolase activator NlpD
MQKKDNRSYTFFLSHKTKTKIYSRHIEISKNIVHTSIVGLILTIAIVSAGFYRDTALAKLNTKSPNEPAIAAKTVEPVQNNSKTEFKSINYDRPASSKDLAIGGETIVSPKPFPTESQAEKNQMDSQLRVIATTSNQAFLPTMWAHLGKINNEFGVRRNPFGEQSYEFHAGLDIDGEHGDVVASPANGIVTEAGWKGGYGNMIEVDHGNGLKTRYGHLSRIGVQVGAAVGRGQIIGLIGSTGRSTGPHLHYELRLHDKPINPRKLLASVPPDIAALGIK